MVSSNKTSQRKRQPQNKVGYSFPKGNLKHVGPYGINESDEAIRFFERNERERAEQNERRQARKEAKRRRKRRQRIVVAIVLCFLLAVGGGVLAFSLMRSTPEPEVEDIVPVATETPPTYEEPASETPAESGTKNTPAASTETDESYRRIINRSNPIPSDYIAGTGELMEIEGKQMETKAGEALQQMVAALRATGMDIIIQSGYRTDADQEYLYNRQINRQGGNELKAATISAVPLTSEHQAGLAVDLSTDGTLEESFAYTEQGKWLKAHCAEYGYILRYPAGKEMITGIISEPWHFRYVGDPVLAQDIMASGKCMEEYYNQYLASEDIEPYLPYLQ